MQDKICKILFLVAIMILSGCSPDESKPRLRNTDKTQLNQPATVLKLEIMPRVSKGLHGDFTDVGFVLQERPWQPIIKGKLDCNLGPDFRASCEIKQNLNQLINDHAYRILIFTKGDTATDKSSDGLACDYFIYKEGTVPDLTISPSSSGECILWQLKYDTGLDEAKIRERVRHILQADDDMGVYDLETTLYDLYKYYDARYPWKQAWQKLLDAVKNNQPLPKKVMKSKNYGSGKLF